jgi:ABC-type glutathione transport system ATPase component
MRIRDHLINNQITPMLKHGVDQLVFHASAVRYKNTVWGFIGNSGAGKSTLAKCLSSRPHIDHWSDDWLETEVHEDGDIFYTIRFQYD